ncbi:MAG: Flp pilus assembly protein CpaB [Chloroflexota bacterium]
MKKRRSGIILMALGVILAIAVGSTMFLTAQQTSGKTAQMGRILVATQEIPERTAVQPGTLAVKSMPVDLIPDGALNSAEQAVGKMTMVRIFPNEIILGSKLADTKGQSGVAYTLQQGQVLMTFPASDIITTGAIKAGDSIDLLITLEPEEKDDKTQQPRPGMPEVAVTQVTLQNLKVVSIGAIGAAPPPASGQNARKDSSTDTLLTFAVSHEDALVLKALKDAPNAKLETVLRAAGDDQKVTIEAMTMRKIVDKYGVK